MPRGSVGCGPCGLIGRANGVQSPHSSHFCGPSQAPHAIGQKAQNHWRTGRPLKVLADTTSADSSGLTGRLRPFSSEARPTRAPRSRHATRPALARPHCPPPAARRRARAGALRGPCSARIRPESPHPVARRRNGDGLRPRTPQGACTPAAWLSAPRRGPPSRPGAFSGQFSKVAGPGWRGQAVRRALRWQRAPCVPRSVRHVPLARPAARTRPAGIPGPTAAPPGPRARRLGAADSASGRGLRWCTSIAPFVRARSPVAFDLASQEPLDNQRLSRQCRSRCAGSPLARPRRAVRSPLAARRRLRVRVGAMLHLGLSRNAPAQAQPDQISRAVRRLKPGCSPSSARRVAAPFLTVRLPSLPVPRRPAPPLPGQLTSKTWLLWRPACIMGGRRGKLKVSVQTQRPTSFALQAHTHGTSH